MFGIEFLFLIWTFILLSFYGIFSININFASFVCSSEFSKQPNIVWYKTPTNFIHATSFRKICILDYFWQNVIWLQSYKLEDFILHRRCRTQWRDKIYRNKLICSKEIDICKCETSWNSFGCPATSSSNFINELS